MLKIYKKPKKLVKKYPFWLKNDFSNFECRGSSQPQPGLESNLVSSQPSSSKQGFAVAACDCAKCSDEAL